MQASEDFLKKIAEIREKKDEYVITLDHDHLYITAKDNEDDCESYHTTPLDVLWEFLLQQGYEVEEG